MLRGDPSAGQVDAITKTTTASESIRFEYRLCLRRFIRILGFGNIVDFKFKSFVDTNSVDVTSPMHRFNVEMGRFFIICVWRQNGPDHCKKNYMLTTKILVPALELESSVGTEGTTDKEWS